MFFDTLGRQTKARPNVVKWAFSALLLGRLFFDAQSGLDVVKRGIGIDTYTEEAPGIDEALGHVPQNRVVYAALLGSQEAQVGQHDARNEHDEGRNHGRGGVTLAFHRVETFKKRGVAFRAQRRTFNTTSIGLADSSLSLSRVWGTGRAETELAGVGAFPEHTKHRHHCL